MKAVDLIPLFEGCRLSSYRDGGGVWTIGYGSTGKDIGPQLTWTMQQCLDRLNLDLLMTEHYVKDLVKVPLSENQTAALESFVYNVGVGHFMGSTLLKKLNAGDYAGAADQFLVWNKDNGQVVHGLDVRRAKEREVFLT